jgi:isochorismate synthase
MSSFAYYRLPYAETYTRVIQHDVEPLRLQSYAELNGRQGFVFAPFAITDQCPLLLLQGDEEELVFSDAPSSLLGMEMDAPSASSVSTTYHVDFSNFHSHLHTGEFRKLVLARCSKEGMRKPLDVEKLFFDACQRYPRMFIALVSTPVSGTWLMATPEILLDGNGSKWQTVALAGTMPLSDEGNMRVSWSTKNIQEQRYVATYVVKTLEQFTGNISEEGPNVIRAGHLLHLRSDFSFTLPDNQHLGNLLQALHPTPAVCGLPKREAWQFILRNEYAPRRYYSGFAGPLHPEGATHLYVSLRCMEMKDDSCLLYAGGGLLRESVEQQEWEETEAKMRTMRVLLDHE